MIEMAAPDIQELLEEQLRQHDVPGAAVGLLSPQGIRSWSAGVLGTTTQVPATVDSVFKIGSITKVYTATLMCALAGRGVVDLDAPVASYVPDLVLDPGTSLDHLTLRHLLTHTSGIDGDVYADTGRGDDSLARYVKGLAAIPPLHAVGETLSYCNAGYNLAGHVAAEILGTTWEEALRDVILRPAGLTSTVTSAEDALLHRVAVGHHGLGRDMRQTSTWSVPRGSGPSATVACTVEDLLRFASLHLPRAEGSQTTNAETGLSTSDLRAMRDRQAHVPAAGMGVDSWGLGWWRTTWGGTAVLGHDGVSSGQRAYLRLVPEHGVAVAVLANGGRANPLSQLMMSRMLADVDVLMTAHERPRPVTHGVGDDGDLVGTYRRSSEDVVLDRDEAGRLTMTVSWTGPLLDGEEDDDDLSEHFILRPAVDLGRPEARVLLAHPMDADPTASPGEAVTVLELADGRKAVHFRMRLSPSVRDSHSSR